MILFLYLHQSTHHYEGLYHKVLQQYHIYSMAYYFLKVHTDYFYSKLLWQLMVYQGQDHNFPICGEYRQNKYDLLPGDK